MRFFDVIAGVAGATLCVAHLALGEPSQEPLRVTYRASPNCGSEAQFLTALRLRAPRVRLARSDEVARIFSVEIAEGSTSTHARLLIREPNGLRTVRDLDTKDCREAVDALALIAALAIDPAAVGAAESATAKNRDVTSNRDVTAKNRDVTAPSASSSPAEGRTANTTKLDGATTPNAPSTEGASSPPSSEALRPRASDADPVHTSDTPTSSVASSAASETVLWRGSAAGQARGGLAPGLLGGGKLGVELDSRSRSWLSPTVRLWAEYSPPVTFALSGARAAFSYGGAALEICPLTVRMTGAFLARPCVLADIGWVFAQGFDVPNARSASRFRLGGGLQARFEWWLAAPISVELDIGCTFPLKRDRFRFDPVLIYESSGIGGIGALGATLHFP